MKASELRIGNVVYGEDGMLHLTTICLIKSILNHDECEWESIQAGSEGYIQLDNIVDIEPIPLTPEWLEKFGFTKQIGNGSLFFKDGFKYNIKANCVGIIVHCGKAGESQQHVCDSICNMISMPYVHQLQNLYFALTGEELAITLQQ